MVTVIGGTITGLFSIVNILVVLGIIVSGIGITNTLLINIMERIRLAATVIGMIFGIVLIYITSDFVDVNSLTFEFGVSPMIMLVIFLFGLIISLIASFTPSRRAAKTPLNEALRYE